MRDAYVHGYQRAESERLQDQAGTLVDLLHGDTAYPPGSTVLEAGCGVGAQTVTLAQRSPEARFTSFDLSASSLAEASRRATEARLSNVVFRPSSTRTTRRPTRPSGVRSRSRPWPAATL